MKRFIEGVDRSQTTLFPDCLEDWIDDDNPVRVIDVFVDELDLGDLGFERVVPLWTGRPAYHPSGLLKLYIYGYLNRVQSSRRLEREAGRNVEVMWLTGRLVPDHKTIADFRKGNGAAIRKVWPIAATTTAMRYWPATRRRSRSPCPSRRPQALRPRAAMASRIFATSPKRTSTSARPASA